MSEDDLTQALTAACICCILAKAGPQRSRILANLYKDERTRALPIFPFLQKVYLERILRQDEARCASWGSRFPCTEQPMIRAPAAALACMPPCGRLPYAELREVQRDQTKRSLRP